MRVCPIRNRRHRPWRRGSPTIAGRYTNCCRFKCRCLAGPPEAVWTSFTGTATLDRALVFVTTVNCGATAVGVFSKNLPHTENYARRLCTHSSTDYTAL